LGEPLSKAIIFDFDGTLVDSEKSIYLCFQIITKLIAPERENFAKNILIGPPLHDTASKILGPKHQNKLNDFINLFIEMHDKKVITNTKPYPHVENILKKLYKAKVPLAIATNKRLAPTKKLVDYFGWQDYFKFIECSDSQKKTRNKDAMIKEIINQDILFNGAYFLGDTVNDGLSANLNQLPFIKASFGYGNNQDWSKVKTFQEIDQFNQILRFI
jgi:phosphoglycolate phosphatase